MKRVPSRVDVDVARARISSRDDAHRLDAPAARACSASSSRMRGSRLADHRRHARLEDPGLLARDLPRACRRGIRCDRGRSTSRRRRAASTTFVESSRPPRPVSITATSTSRAREIVERHRGRRLEERRAESLDRSASTASMKSTTSSSAIGSPSTTMRSRKSTRCGDVYVPTRRPFAREQRLGRRDAASLPVRAGDVKRRDTRGADRRARASSARVRSRPNLNAPVVRANR